MTGRHAPPFGTALQQNRWLRTLLPTLLILGWLAVTGLGGPYFGRISEVTTESATDRLPRSAPSTQVAQQISDFQDSEAIPAILVFERPEGITEQDAAWAQELTRSLPDDPTLGPWVDPAGTSPVIPSQDGQALQAIVPISDETDPGKAVEALQDRLADKAPAGLQTSVTGPAGFTAALSQAFSGIDGILLLVAFAVVFVILLVVYRSPLLPVLVLLTSMAALCACIVVIWHLADAGWVTLNGQIQGILFILVIGAATDYSLLYTARYREALLHTERRWPATLQALRGTFEPVAASGGTVIAGVLCLLLSGLKTNAALGPVAASGIVFSMLAALTFLPAMLLVLGRAAFWPFRPRFHGEDFTPKTTWWGKLAQFVSRAPRRIWLVSVIVLGVLALCALQFRASGVAQSELILGPSQARTGQAVLAEHFPGGSGTPVQIIVAEDELDDAVAVIQDTEGIASTQLASMQSPTGSVPLAESQRKGPPSQGAEPTVVGGRVLLEATLTAAPDSEAAEQTVLQLREELAGKAPTALVGGMTAQNVDILHASQDDRRLLIPMILLVITLILMLLLRSVLAPVLLLATTVLSYFSTLGVGALVFHHLLGFENADPSVPLYAFVFLVALGIDYNIFLMTRVREESLAQGTRQGVLQGLRLTGGVITSAGIVLAATFAALSVIPLMFMVQLSFLVAFGVLLDASLVRALLVPALVYDLGDRIWWPSRLTRGATESGTQDKPAVNSR